MEKNKDQKGRWRNHTVGFRVSDEEAEMIDLKVRLSGLTKQDYIIKRLAEKNITVIGNPRVFKALKREMQSIYSELKRIETIGDLSEELLDKLEQIMIVMEGLSHEN